MQHPHDRSDCHLYEISQNDQLRRAMGDEEKVVNTRVKVRLMHSSCCIVVRIIVHEFSRDLLQLNEVQKFICSLLITLRYGVYCPSEHMIYLTNVFLLLSCQDCVVGFSLLTLVVYKRA